MTVWSNLVSGKFQILNTKKQITIFGKSTKFLWFSYND